MNGTTSLPLLSESEGPPLKVPIPILHDLIQASVQKHGPQTALVCRHQTANLLPAVTARGRSHQASNHPSYLQWTHDQLQYSADLLAVGLFKAGVRANSTIAALLDGQAEFHMALRASVKLKCPFSPIRPSTASSASDIRHILTSAGAEVVLVGSAIVAAQLEKAVPDLMSAMKARIIVGSDTVPTTYRSLNVMVSDAAKDPDFPRVSSLLNEQSRSTDDTVFIWFTSGTTSLPKAAPHTNKSLTANIGSWRQVLGIDETRSWLQILPMNSIVGSSWTLAYFVSGGSVTHANFNFDVLAIASTICEGQYTDVLAVPSMIDLLAASPLLRSPQNKGIGRMIVGGSPILRSHVKKSFEILKCQVFQPFFGMTEGTSVCTETLYQTPTDVKAPIYAGYVNPGAKIRICAPDDTKPLPRGVPGELVQGGSQKIEYYLGGSGKECFFTDAGETWFRCGDQATMMEDGRIVIVGRYKDIIIRGGMNIAAAAVEAVISEGTGVEAQVIGVPDEAAGEVPVAVILHPEEGSSVPRRVQKCVLDRMGPSYALEQVIHLRDLGLSDWPKTATGKILKRELKKLLRTWDDQTFGSRNEFVPQDSKGDNESSHDESRMQDAIIQRAQSMGIDVANIDDNLYEAGLDSLSALRFQNYLVRDLKLRQPLSPTAIFQHGTVGRLAKFLINENLRSIPLCCWRTGDLPEDQMAAMISKHCHFRQHNPINCEMPQKHTVLLTGVTGSLGAHILSVLGESTGVDTIYCLIRGPNPSERLRKSISKRSMNYTKFEAKVKIITHDVGLEGLGMDEKTRQVCLDKLTVIIHAAWPVNFQLPLSSFGPQMQDLQSMIDLSLSVRLPLPASVFFCSSVGVAFATKGQRMISEEPIMDLRQGSTTGYTQSKLVAEYIVQRAVEDSGARASNLRIGQVIGDTKLGIWNESEAFPLMIRSAWPLGCLPSLGIDCSWIPVDTLAKAIVELAMLCRQNPPELVYNLCNPRNFSWDSDILPSLAAAGLRFEVVPVETWVAKLREYQDSHDLEEATKMCPAIKLMDYWEATYCDERQPAGAINFSTYKAQADSLYMRSAPDVVGSGLVELMLEAWSSL